MVDGTATGFPRPMADGLPVPWITPVGDQGPVWDQVIRHRIIDCQRDWLCQVCGMPLPSRAWVLVEGESVVMDDAAMHEQCMKLALARCPHLSEQPAYTARCVSMKEIAADGVPLLQVSDFSDRMSWNLRTGS